MMFRASGGLESIFFKDSIDIYKNEWILLKSFVFDVKEFYLDSLGYDELDSINLDMSLDLKYYNFFINMDADCLTGFLGCIRRVMLGMDWGFVDNRMFLLKFFSMFNVYIDIICCNFFY